MKPTEFQSAYPATQAYLKGLLQTAQLDRPALGRPLAPCVLEHCLGTCCHDGVYLNPDEARLIPTLIPELDPGLDLPPDPIVFSERPGRANDPKTAIKPVPMASLVPDYPKHFPDTNCVFLAEDGKCALQTLSIRKGHHPWHYKPFTCWIHPLSIIRGNGGTHILTLHNRESDPQQEEGYDGFVSSTHCGRETTCGKPAYEVLQEELRILGLIAGRDFLGELRPTFGGDPCG